MEHPLFQHLLEQDAYILTHAVLLSRPQYEDILQQHEWLHANIAKALKLEVPERELQFRLERWLDALLRRQGTYLHRAEQLPAYGALAPGHAAPETWGLFLPLADMMRESEKITKELLPQERFEATPEAVPRGLRGGAFALKSELPHLFYARAMSRPAHHRHLLLNTTTARDIEREMEDMEDLDESFKRDVLESFRHGEQQLQEFCYNGRCAGLCGTAPKACPSPKTARKRRGQSKKQQPPREEDVVLASLQALERRLMGGGSRGGSRGQGRGHSKPAPVLEPQHDLMALLQESKGRDGSVRCPREEHVTVRAQRRLWGGGVHPPQEDDIPRAARQKPPAWHREGLPPVQYAAVSRVPATSTLNNSALDCPVMEYLGEASRDARPSSLHGGRAPSYNLGGVDLTDANVKDMAMEGPDLLGWNDENGALPPIGTTPSTTKDLLGWSDENGALPPVGTTPSTTEDLLGWNDNENARPPAGTAPSSSPPTRTAKSPTTQSVKELPKRERKLLEQVSRESDEGKKRELQQELLAYRQGKKDTAQKRTKKESVTKKELPKLLQTFREGKAQATRDYVEETLLGKGLVEAMEEELNEKLDSMSEWLTAFNKELDEERSWDELKEMELPEPDGVWEWLKRNGSSLYKKAKYVGGKVAFGVLKGIAYAGKQGFKLVRLMLRHPTFTTVVLVMIRTLLRSMCREMTVWTTKKMNDTSGVFIKEDKSRYGFKEAFKGNIADLWYGKGGGEIVQAGLLELLRGRIGDILKHGTDALEVVFGSLTKGNAFSRFVGSTWRVFGDTLTEGVATYMEISFFGKWVFTQAEVIGDILRMLFNPFVRCFQWGLSEMEHATRFDADDFPVDRFLWAKWDPVQGAYFLMPHDLFQLTKRAPEPVVWFITDDSKWLDMAAIRRVTDEYANSLSPYTCAEMPSFTMTLKLWGPLGRVLHLNQKGDVEIAMDAAEYAFLSKLVYNLQLDMTEAKFQEWRQKNAGVSGERFDASRVGMPNTAESGYLWSILRTLGTSLQDMGATASKTMAELLKGSGITGDSALDHMGFSVWAAFVDWDRVRVLNDPYAWKVGVVSAAEDPRLRVIRQRFPGRPSEYNNPEDSFKPPTGYRGVPGRENILQANERLIREQDAGGNPEENQRFRDTSQQGGLDHLGYIMKDMYTSYIARPLQYVVNTVMGAEEVTVASAAAGYQVNGLTGAAVGGLVPVAARILNDVLHSFDYVREFEGVMPVYGVGMTPITLPRRLRKVLAKKLQAKEKEWMSSDEDANRRVLNLMALMLEDKTRLIDNPPKQPEPPKSGSQGRSGRSSSGGNQGTSSSSGGNRQENTPKPKRKKCRNVLVEDGLNSTTYRAVCD